MAIIVPRDILEKPPATLTAALLESDTALFLRMDPWDLGTLPRRCSADLRLGVWDIDDVLLFALALRLAHNDTTTFDCMIDIGQPSGMRVIDGFSNQDHLDVHVITDTLARSLRLVNADRTTASRIAQRVRSHAAWTVEDFRRAATRLNRLYPTPHSLWWSCERSTET